MVGFGFPQRSAHAFPVASAHRFRGFRAGWVYPASWCLCKSSAPNTNYENGIAYSSSRSHNTFASESKTAFKFDPVLKFDTPYQINFGRFGANMTGHTDLARTPGISGYGGNITWDATGNLALTRIYALIRLTPILEDFDTGALTWNTLGTLTLGVSFNVCPWVATMTPANANNSNTHSAFTADPFDFVSNYSFTPNNVVGSIGGLSVPEPASPPNAFFYGFLMEVFCHTIPYPGFSGSSNVAQYTHVGLTVENKQTVYS